MSQSKPCILIVDDEPQIRKMLEVTFNSLNFKTIEAESGSEAIRLAASHKPQAVILDLGLPDMDGVDVLRRLREWSEVPVVVVSARSDSRHIIEAFEAGANDYMTKPFDMNVLLVRLNAAIKHTYQKEVGESVIEAGAITMDLVRHEVKINGTLVEFSPKEYELLSFMLRHKEKMLTHRQILKEVWGDAHAYDKQYLRVYIMQLRQKIERNPQDPEYIITEAGIGYRFDIPSDFMQVA